MSRRAVVRAIAALAVVVAAGVSKAQPRARIALIGVPLIAAGVDDPVLSELRRGLKEFGWVEGETYRIEHRSAEGKPERLPALVQELVKRNVDVIVAGAEPIVLAAKQATNTIPIVMVGRDYDPVAVGFVQSLNRPGGNITGVFLQTGETAGKRLELLKELLPGLVHVAVLYDSSIPSGKRQFEEAASAARVLKLAVQPIALSSPYDYEGALQAVGTNTVVALAVLFSPKFYVDRQRIAHTALARHLPTMFDELSSVRAGGLISYGPSTNGWQRAGYFVDRILTGTRPSDLPVETPKVYSLRINMRTAKALRVAIPESILLRADEVIR